jgi:hypothetical protein
MNFLYILTKSANKRFYARLIALYTHLRDCTLRTLLFLYQNISPNPLTH